MEYLAMGKAVIVTNIEAHKHLLGSHGFAIIPSSNHPEKLASAIIEAYTNKDKLNNAGKRARQLISRKYTWDFQARLLEEYLAGLF
jgi:glycosyltransferase involved in cell wall biosynthesis